MRATQSIDVMDAIGSAISVDTRGREVVRILPRNNDAVNEEWISDKTRHVCDGLRTQRLDRPYIRRRGRLEPATWTEALELVGAKLKAARGERIAAIAGDLAAAEEMFALADLFMRLGSSNLDCRQDGAKLDPRLGRASYLFNSGIEGIDRADAILLVGSNPRLEAAVLNVRLRRRQRQGNAEIALIGQRVDLSYPYAHIGTSPEALAALVRGEHPFAGVLRAARLPMVIVGSCAIAHGDGAAVLSAAARIALACAEGKEPGWNPFNVLHAAASRVAGLDLGFVPGAGGLDVSAMLTAAAKGRLDVVYLLGADEIPMQFGDAFVVYQGSHGDAGAERADVVLPGAAYTEKSGTYVNTEGRAQMTRKAAFAPGDAKEDWAIVRALSGHVGRTLPYDDLAALRRSLYKGAPQLARIDAREAAPAAALADLAARGGALGGEGFGQGVRDFYLTNAIARASAVMAELSHLRKGGFVGPPAAVQQQAVG
jgi:NADH-quinone oxidoreductase subunit G